MPNHVMNKWKISHIPQDKLQYILDKLTMITEKGDRIIDFDLIIPEPRYKKDCPADCIVNRITSPGITPGIKNLLNDMVLTYYQVCDIIYRRKEELVCLKK